MAKIRPLSPELEEFAKTELNEDPAHLEQDLQHLKDWLTKQPHLRARTDINEESEEGDAIRLLCAFPDDQFLVAFLRGCKFSLERTKEKLDAYYTLRSALPEFFMNRDPASPQMQRYFKLGTYLPLGVDAQGRRIILLRSSGYNPEEEKIQDIIKANMMMIEVLMMEDDALVVKGEVSVQDSSGMTLAHASRMTPALGKRFATVIQDGYPLRPKAFHYVSLNPLFLNLFNLFKTFLKKKFVERIHMHSDMSSLYKDVPQELLPNEYGGKAGSIQELAEAQAAKMLSYRQYFLEDEKFGVDESKRPGRPKTHEDLFGMEGSFRPLNVD